MSYKEILVNNLKALSQANGCELNASKFTRLINEKAGSAIIDRSYIARIFRNSSKDPANISMGKLFLIADALSIEPWQLVHPSGFDGNGDSKQTRNGKKELDVNLLRNAFMTRVLDFAELNKVSFVNDESAAKIFDDIISLYSRLDRLDK